MIYMLVTGTIPSIVSVTTMYNSELKFLILILFNIHLLPKMNVSHLFANSIYLVHTGLIPVTGSVSDTNSVVALNHGTGVVYSTDK